MGDNGSGSQLALNAALSSLGVKVLCPDVMPCAVGAAACHRDDVLDLEAGHDEPLWTQAVAATVAGRVADAADEVDGQVVTRHRQPGADGVLGPRPP